jgi:hypothetical protein
VFDYVPAGWPDQAASIARLDRAVKRLGCGSKTDPDSIVITCFQPELRIAACAMLANEFKCFCAGVGVTADQCPALFEALWNAGADDTAATAESSSVETAADAGAANETGSAPVAQDVQKPE